MTPEQLATDYEQDRGLLRDILVRKSLRFGKVNLSSGQESSIYLDAKLTTCSASAISLVGKVFVSKIRQQGWTPSAVGGLTLGADPIAFSIAAESGKAGAFVVRKEPKKYGMQRYIEGLEHTSGLPVVVIDDVCTTGRSIAIAIEKAMGCGMNVLGAICLVDRQMGAQQMITSSFGLNLVSVFLLADLERNT